MRICVSFTVLLILASIDTLSTAWASIFRHSLRRSRWLIRPLRSSDVSFLYLRYFRRIAYRTVQP